MNFRYYMEFKVLPDQAFNNTNWLINEVLSKKGLGLMILYNVFAKRLGIVNPYVFEDFDVEFTKIDDDRFIIVIHMPKKDLIAPLCKTVYITLFSEDDNLSVRYFTKEYSINDCYFIGEVRGDAHFNHGIAPDDETEVFKAVTKFAFDI